MLMSVTRPSIKKSILAMVGHAMTQKVATSANAILDEERMLKIITFANLYCPNQL